MYYFVTEKPIDDFHILDYFFDKTAWEKDPNTIKDTVLRGFVVIDNSDTNKDRRITGMTTCFIEMAGIQPVQIRKLDALKTIIPSKDRRSLMVSDLRKKEKGDGTQTSSSSSSSELVPQTKIDDYFINKKVAARNIVKFREFEIDEDDFHALDAIISTPDTFTDVNEVFTVRDCILNKLVQIRNCDDGECWYCLGNCKKRVTGLTFVGHAFERSELPTEIGRLDGLERLCCEQCYSMETIPKEIGQLVNLEILDLDGCEQLKEIPRSIGNLSNLRQLYLGECFELSELPSTIGELANLIELSINPATLKNVPESIGKLPCLRHLMAKDRRIDIDGELILYERVSSNTIIDPFLNLEHLTKISISVQDFVRFQENSFAGFNKLQELNLEWNVGQYFEVTTPIELPAPPLVEIITIVHEGMSNEDGEDDDEVPILALFQSNWLSRFPRLRSCTICSKTYDSELRRLRVDLSDLRNHKNLQELNLSECELFHSTKQLAFTTGFSGIRKLTLADCNGRINFLDFNFAKLECLSLIEVSKELRFEIEDKDQSEAIQDKSKCFSLDTLRYCPKLTSIKVSGSSQLNIQFSRGTFALFPFVETATFARCDFSFVGQLDASAPTILMQSLIELDLNKCNRFWYTPEFSTMKFELPSLKDLSCNGDVLLENNEFENLLKSICSSSPNITKINLSSCGVTEISSTALSYIPRKLSILDLSSNPIFETVSGRDSLSKLLQQSEGLGSIGSSPNSGHNDPATGCTELGYMMSFNRARSKVLLDQEFCTSLWPLILKNAPKAFKKNSGDNFFFIKEKADAIYQLLRERGVKEIFMVADKQQARTKKRIRDTTDNNGDGKNGNPIEKRTRFYRD